MAKENDMTLIRVATNDRDKLREIAEKERRTMIMMFQVILEDWIKENNDNK